ncbi:alpha/beta hydrolase [Sphaerisporangium sp. NPDC005289]|uniref:alpha/beta fold hydrolase n=1 Tax=Sphaerisporangium sp. NPDC005289 TaxID=3155247 RepID=UPI0033B64C6C
MRYRLRGTGPLLLLIAGGDGDADASQALADGLTDRYTVLTYDRRGLSGSTLDDPARPPTITTHADDAHHLLAALTVGPALVYGSSIGALIALELVARHPEQVSVLVAHEPPATQVLPDAERAEADQAQREVERTFEREGALAALQKFLVVAGIDPADREEDAPLRPPGRERVANLTFFLTHDAPAVRRHRLALDALRSAGTRVVLAVGESSGPIMPYRCTRLLAEALGLPCEKFPGGHNGGVFHPKAFAARLREVLNSPDHIAAMRH